MKQSMGSIKQVIKSIIPKPKQWYYTHAQSRSMYLAGLRGTFVRHQNNKEKARRVRQMAEHKCINPECWTDNRPQPGEYIGLDSDGTRLGTVTIDALP
jgi:hypothetical protein